LVINMGGNVELLEDRGTGRIELAKTVGTMAAVLLDSCGHRAVANDHRRAACTTWRGTSV
jgi:hypothetical protein